MPIIVQSKTLDAATYGLGLAGDTPSKASVVYDSLKMKLNSSVSKAIQPIKEMADILADPGSFPAPAIPTSTLSRFSLEAYDAGVGSYADKRLVSSITTLEKPNLAAELKSAIVGEAFNKSDRLDNRFTDKLASSIASDMAVAAADSVMSDPQNLNALRKAVLDAPRATLPLTIALALAGSDEMKDKSPLERAATAGAVAAGSAMIQSIISNPTLRKAILTGAKEAPTIALRTASPAIKAALATGTIATSFQALTETREKIMDLSSDLNEVIKSNVASSIETLKATKKQLDELSKSIEHSLKETLATTSKNLEEIKTKIKTVASDLKTLAKETSKETAATVHEINSKLEVLTTAITDHLSHLEKPKEIASNSSTFFKENKALCKAMRDGEEAPADELGVELGEEDASKYRPE